MPARGIATQPSSRPDRAAAARQALAARDLAAAGGDPARAEQLRRDRASRAGQRSGEARRLRSTQRVDALVTIGALADYVRRVVDGAPPLTPEQIDQLAVIFNGAKSA